jgi:hypothetical protein
VFVLGKFECQDLFLCTKNCSKCICRNCMPENSICPFTKVKIKTRHILHMWLRYLYRIREGNYISMCGNNIEMRERSEARISPKFMLQIIPGGCVQTFCTLHDEFQSAYVLRTRACINSRASFSLSDGFIFGEKTVATRRKDTPRSRARCSLSGN